MSGEPRPVMVCGAAGFLGSHLVERLLHDGLPVDAVDDLSTGSLGNLATARTIGGTLKFHTLDVFTDKRFGGNPLAVVLDADGLDTDRMQAVAREFNLSETVFVEKPVNPAHSAKVRIFTPMDFYDFAGHPTVGGGRQRLVLELLGPNLRPVQVTDDLPGFWERLYPEVKKELKRRYPRHEWR